MKSGTDLYSEIDDKRQQLEERNNSYRRRIESMKRELDMADHQKTQLRNQVSMLMHTRGNRADAADRRRLEQALSQNRAENIQLGARIMNLERRIEAGHARIREQQESFAGAGDKQVYIEYLESELEHKKVEMRRMNEELRTKVLEKMSESEKLRKAERGLHDADSKNDQIMLKMMEMRMDKEELQMKNATLETIQQNAEKEQAKKEELRAKAKRENELQLTNAAIANSLRGSLALSPAQSSASTPSLASGSLLDEMASLGDAGSYEPPSTPPARGSPAAQRDATNDADAGEGDADTDYAEGGGGAEGDLDGSALPEDGDRTPARPHGHEGLRSPISFDSPAGKVGPTVIDLSDDQVNECPTQ